MRSRFNHGVRSVLLLAAVVIGLAACQDDDEASTIEGVTVSFDVQDKFKTSTTTFTQGETIRFVCAVSNNASSAVSLGYTFPACQPRVRSLATGDIVWDPYYDMVFTQVVTNVEVVPGESLTFVVEWDMQPTPELASEVPPGSYRAEPGFYMASDGGELRLDETESIDFTIQ